MRQRTRVYSQSGFAPCIKKKKKKSSVSIQTILVLFVQAKKRLYQLSVTHALPFEHQGKTVR